MPYVVTSPITYLGRAYAVGDAIEPKPQVIGQLVASGCIKEVPPPVPATPASQSATPASHERRPLIAAKMTPLPKYPPGDPRCEG